MKTKKEPKLAPAIDWETQYKRALADYANLVNRQDRERSVTVKLANAILLEKVLTIVDELELALGHQPNPGVQLTLDKLRKILQDEGCEEIKIGNSFCHPDDPFCFYSLVDLSVKRNTNSQ